MGKIIHVISLTITLTLLIFSLVVNITIKEATNEIMKETINTLVPNEVTEKVEGTNEWIQNILKNEDIIGKIKEATGYEVTEEFIKEQLGEININNMIEQQEKQLTPEKKMIWDIVKFFSSMRLKGILLFAIIIELILIAFAEKSLYKWIKPFAWALSLSGVGLFLASTWIREHLNSLLNTSNITLSGIIDPAICLMVSGVVIRLVYGIIVRIVKANQEKKKEVEEHAIS